MQPTLTPRPATPNTAPRMDLYVAIHKALRGFMTETLARVGRIDVLDDDEMARTLGQLDDLLTFCEGHVKHENEFIHAAIEARQPAGSARTADDHEDHLETLAVLRNQAFALKAAVPATRTTLALRLYRHLALFVAENLHHMHLEETANNATLWALYTDEELHAIHDRLLATITPAEQMLVARWMIPALSPSERAGLMSGMRAGMPFEAFAAVLEVVRPHIDAPGWAKLMRALGLASPVKFA